MLAPNPLWKSGPLICSEANLPAFESNEEMMLFIARNGPSCFVVRTWICEFCGQFHARTLAPDPSGISSGTGRNHKHVDDPI